jgi:hypothetical protein
MATWFTVVGRIAQIEGISDHNYKNALIEFEEGDTVEKERSSWRSFYVTFWGDLLRSRRCYIIFGTGRLTGNEDCTQPKVRFLTLKVMFLTNSMLAEKVISNGSIGVITDILDNNMSRLHFLLGIEFRYDCSVI